jgi:hypothetical protein
MTEHAPDDFIETDLVNLGNCSLRDLSTRQDADLLDAVARVRSEAARPRKNLGSSGPPGRAD